ncbi:MAG: class I SAM-dependent methyltransferase [Halobacteriales archaeon]|nr:class I SAM-dependent methyltransferase [Halobacteriales archaeon]
MLWPAGFARIPDEPWVRDPIDTLAEKYDKVEHHGWYDNLDPTVDDLRGFASDGMRIVDYSGGTGILIDRFLRAAPEAQVGLIDVDASPKFLRLALEKFRGDERVAFRWLRFLKPEQRLHHLDEVLGPLAGQVDAVVSTNAIHLYADVPGTLHGWHRGLRARGKLFVQSGNIRVPPQPGGKPWIIDDTVEAVHWAAAKLVADDAQWERWRGALDDEAWMARHAELRAKYFIPPRPLDLYVQALQAAGFAVEDVRTRPIRARVDEWTEFLAVYHDGILGWVGGAEKVTGKPADPLAVDARLDLLREAVRRVFGGRDHFDATWTYLTCVRQ